ncbi:hypothetical protein ACZ75_07520 [Massilia sp. NR 4-1]|nr:hypothetical protein ACZ75_07520 [Massilia sp. NR 4-1]
MAGTLSAGAQTVLTDPTKPPPEAMLAPGAESVPAAPAGPQLQSVLVGAAWRGREVAVIDGEIVRRGETFRGAVLEKVGPGEVVLRKNGKAQVLRVFPETAGKENRK